jgi:hypothetical protein
MGTGEMSETIAAVAEAAMSLLASDPTMRISPTETDLLIVTRTKFTGSVVDKPTSPGVGTVGLNSTSTLSLLPNPLRLA